LVEPLSLDEAYLDVTDNLKGLPTAWETAKEIRSRICEDTKLTASAGISGNKFLAKIVRRTTVQYGATSGICLDVIARLPGLEHLQRTGAQIDRDCLGSRSDGEAVALRPFWAGPPGARRDGGFPPSLLAIRRSASSFGKR
jgi:impB/mucB/samB family